MSTILVALIPCVQALRWGAWGKGRKVCTFFRSNTRSETWKGAFDRFSGKRQQSGVRRHQVLRPTDDPNYVVIELGFESASEAESFLAWLRREVWSSREERRP